MPENSQQNFAGIEVALKTLRAVLIAEDGRVLGRCEAAYDPDELITAVGDMPRAFWKYNSRLPQQHSAPAWGRLLLGACGTAPPAIWRSGCRGQRPAILRHRRY